MIGSVVALGLASHGRRLSDGPGRGAGESFLDAGHRRVAGSRRRPRSGRPVSTASCGSTPPVGLADWAKDPEGSQKDDRRDLQASRATIAQDHGEKLAAEGEICWGGMHSWRAMVDLLERVGEPETVGFQADMAHTLLYTLGENAPDDRILPKGYDWKDPAVLDQALKTLTDALRPWTLDFHVAQNDATVFGSGSHDHTGRHCLPNDPNGKLDIPRHAGFWLQATRTGRSTKRLAAHLPG